MFADLQSVCNVRRSAVQCVMLLLFVKWQKGLPIEVLPFAYKPVKLRLEKLGGSADLRMAKQKAVSGSDMDLLYANHLMHTGPSSDRQWEPYSGLEIYSISGEGCIMHCMNSCYLCVPSRTLTGLVLELNWFKFLVSMLL